MLSRDGILALKPGRGFDIAIGSALGWQWWSEQRGEYLFILVQEPGEREPYRVHRNWEYESKRYALFDIATYDSYKHIMQSIGNFSTEDRDAIPLLWHLQTAYGGALVLTNSEWGKEMAQVVCQGIDSGSPSTLPVALCRMVLLMAERDKQKIKEADANG